MQASPENRRPFIILTDATESGDDGVAIAMIVTHPRVDVKLIVCTSGNVWANEVAENVQKLLRHLGKEGIPLCVYSPEPKLLHRAQGLLTAFRHEKHGYMGAFSKPIPRSGPHSECRDLRQTIAETPGISLLILAPPSSIAALQRENPELIPRLGPVFMMGGALHVAGNATPYAEFNFWFDAEATEALLAADLDIILFPQDVANRLSYPEKIRDSQHSSTPSISYLQEYLARRKGRSRNPLGIWDEALSAIVLKPDLIESTLSSEVQVTTVGPQTGRLKLVDKLRRRKVRIITGIDQKRTVKFILESLS